MSEIRSVRRPSPRELERAREIVGERLGPTPLLAVNGVLRRWSLKLESLQPTGSFKVRGALSAGTQLPSGPIVTASTGNHALAMAWASALLDIDVTVVIPETAAAPKADALRRMPVTLATVGSSVHEAERHAVALARERSGHYVSPYNDPLVIAGQATLGWELQAQASPPLTIVCPVGGGGLLAGLCLWAARRRDIRLIGVEPAASPALSAAVRAGAIVDVPVGETLADGSAGQVEPGSVTVSIAAERVDDLVTVEEDEIRAAICWLATSCGVVAEGAGACAVAAVRSGAVKRKGAGVMLVTGRNVAVDVLAETLAASLA